jgi:hypothetical protein
MDFFFLKKKKKQQIKYNACSHPITNSRSASCSGHALDTHLNLATLKYLIPLGHVKTTVPIDA